MYRHNEKQLKFIDFDLPFGGRLLSDNRWMRLSELIPWHEFEEQYCKNLSDSGHGPPAFSVRMALAALIIKERLGVTDEECVEQIRENPYLQYFCGFKAFSTERPFHPTMLVYFRKRFSEKVLMGINETIVSRANKAAGKDDDTNPDGGVTGNGGKLVLDATCAPADISYPTDLKLLNSAREKTEKIIDTLFKTNGTGKKKPRTYRIKARKAYLAAAKSKRLGAAALRKVLRIQLGCVRRNLTIIDVLSEKVGLSALSSRQYRELLVINELHRQQQWMFDHKSCRIDDRIVSISQPHVRPIKRGKAGCDTEFGAKLSVSLVNGYAFVDHIGWDNFNESLDLQSQVEAYKNRFGVYPESVHADRIYRNRGNLAYCREKNIRLSGPRLGRPSKFTADNAALLRHEAVQAREDELERIPIEGKFGQAKRRFGLGRIMAKLASTSKTVIALCFLVMNLEKWLAAIFIRLFFKELIPRFQEYLRLLLSVYGPDEAPVPIAG